MKWKTRVRQIDAMKARHRGQRYRVPLPDLSYEVRGAPMSHTIPAGAAPPREAPAGSKRFASGTTHKQGPMLLTPGMIANEMQFIGGRKV